MSGCQPPDRREKVSQKTGSSAETDPGGDPGLGALTGIVKLGPGPVPEVTRILNTTDPEVCGRSHALDDLVVSPENRGIRYVIVALADVPEARIPSFAPGRLILENADCRFTPHASVITVGGTIEAVNRDPVLHTTHFYGSLEANLSLPIQGARSTRTAHRAGLIGVRCDLHGWMQAFIRVDPHPFHAVTDASGTFRIPDIPAGTFTVESWHQKLGTERRTVRIEAGKTEHLEVEYSPAGR